MDIHLGLIVWYLIFRITNKDFSCDCISLVLSECGQDDEMFVFESLLNLEHWLHRGPYQFLREANWDACKSIISLVQLVDIPFSVLRPTLFSKMHRFWLSVYILPFRNFILSNWCKEGIVALDRFLARKHYLFIKYACNTDNCCA